MQRTGPLTCTRRARLPKARSAQARFGVHLSTEVLLRGEAGAGDPPAWRKRTQPRRAAVGCARLSCWAGRWVAAHPGQMQAEGLLQSWGGTDPIFRGFCSNLSSAERGTGLKARVRVANAMLVISGFSREINQPKKVGSVWDLGRPNPIPGFMLF